MRRAFGHNASTPRIVNAPPDERPVSVDEAQLANDRCGDAVIGERGAHVLHLPLDPSDQLRTVAAADEHPLGARTKEPAIHL